MKELSTQMSQMQRECRAHERWLAEYTDHLQDSFQAQEPQREAPQVSGCCWQCDTAATLYLIIRTVRVQLCETCAEQKRQELTTALSSLATPREDGPRGEDATEPGD
jgi:hypothetical protein